MYRRSEESQAPNHSRRQPIRIDILPHDVLLEIFDFYTNPIFVDDSMTVAWQFLVHVCRRWRSLVFSSPRRLNLELYCTPATPVRDTLDVWPALPLIISGDMTSSATDNVIAAFGQSDRVRQVLLWNLGGWRLEQVLAAMQVSFPELTYLSLSSYDETPRLIPDAFLDESAPRLRIFYLSGIPFPGLPRLHLSAPHLVSLHLLDIPHSGYFPPEAIVALLSMLSSLEELCLRFRSPQSRPDWESRRPPPSKRSVIPVLVSLRFTGVTEYLEDFVTFIDAPQLRTTYIRFFNQIDFDTPRLAQFINRTFNLAKHDAHVQFDDYRVELQLESGTLDIAISCREPDWQLSSIEQVFNSPLHSLSMVEDLYIERRYRRLVWKDDPIENTLWLQFLYPFTAVKNLYLSKELSQCIAASLQELVASGGRITEVLPSLQNIFVAGLEHPRPFQETIGQFVAARQLSNHPITISDWDIDQ